VTLSVENAGTLPEMLIGRWIIIGVVTAVIPPDPARVSIFTILAPSPALLWKTVEPLTLAVVGIASAGISTVTPVVDPANGGITILGTSLPPVGVNGLLTTDQLPCPTEFLAATLNTYDVPPDNPVTSILVEVSVSWINVVQVEPLFAEY
jgi:hypothetical protein